MPFGDILYFTTISPCGRKVQSFSTASRHFMIFPQILPHIQRRSSYLVFNLLGRRLGVVFLDNSHSGHSNGDSKGENGRTNG
jgi:hypothetical protein